MNPEGGTRNATGGEPLGTSSVPSSVKPLETSYVPFTEHAEDDTVQKSSTLCADVFAIPSTPDAREKEMVQACYLALAAIAGCLLRIIMAQLFGEECANPGTIGWLSAAAPLCVTKDGDTVQEGGIVFSDLPANIVGSFFMGLLQSAAVLGLTVPMAVAWLSPNHPFQRMTILHKALTTGFCGSLTTFSSWNSEMVVMIFGTGNNLQTQVISAILGYIIGMETALGSFACGKSVAIRIFRVINPTLSVELDAARERVKQGIPVNKELPDFERRFLPRLDMGQPYDILVPLQETELLARWRDSTESARRLGHNLLPLLTEIETAVLVNNRNHHHTPHNKPVITSESESVARAEGWDIDALMKWQQKRSSEADRLPSLGSVSTAEQSFNVDESPFFHLPVAAGLVVGIYALLFSGLVLLNDDQEMTVVTYRTMVYAMMFAPFGALLRWRLAAWNGKCTYRTWEWLPLGTLTVNVLGSLVSAVAIGGEYHHLHGRFTKNEGFWLVGTIRAVKVGFAGCLTTVSTFAAEVSGFMHNGTDHGYPYIGVSLGISFIGSCIVYSSVVFL